MPRKHHPDPEVYDYRIGMGCMRAFGLPFLLGGLFAIVLALSPEAGRRDVPDWYIVLPGGLLLAGVGVLLVFTRRGTEIDRRNGRVTKWWRLLWFERRTEHPLSDFHQVVMSQRQERGNRRSYTVYPVCLSGPSVRRVEVDTKLTFAGGRELAEDIVRFTGLSLEDSSEGSPIVRLASEIDASLAERKRDDLQWEDLPEAPSSLRSSVEVIGDTIRFDIPPAGFGRRDRWWLVGGLVAPVCIYFGWLEPMWWRGVVPLPLFVALVGVLMVMPFLTFYLPAVRGALRRTRVEASPRDIRVRTRGLFGRTRSLLSHTIQQINVVDEYLFRGEPAPRERGRKLIVVRGDRKALSFGLGLPQAELDWICTVLHRVAEAA